MRAMSAISRFLRRSVVPVPDPRQSGRSKSPRGAPRRIFTPRGGFTLLEVMIAMAIMAIALVAVYQSQSQSVSMASDSRFLTTASLLAQSRMAEIDADTSKAIAAATNGDFGEAFPDYRWQMDVGNVEEIPLLKRITLTVTNSRMTKRNTYRLTLYKVVLP
jgi:general secretion pathway protein I